MIHTVKGFGVVNEADVFMELLLLIQWMLAIYSGSSAFSKTSLNIWKFTVHVLLKPGAKQRLKLLPAMRETWVRSLGREDPLEKETATHARILGQENPMEGGAWWATVHGVAKSRTQLSNFTFFHFHLLLIKSTFVSFLFFLKHLKKFFCCCSLKGILSHIILLAIVCAIESHWFYLY